MSCKSSTNIVFVAALSLLLTLTACGGGGGGGAGGGTPTPGSAGGVNAPASGADTVAPVISLNGANPLSVSRNSTFTDPGALVTDNIDTNLTATASGVVDTSVIGSYTLTYQAKDQAGNAATAVSRIVNVNAAAVLTAPTVIATALTANSVGLSWGAISGATGYTVWQDSSSNLGVVKKFVKDTTATTFEVLQLAPNTAYKFYVTSHSAAGGSDFSAAANVTTLTTVALPAVPAGLTALAGVTQVNLSWSAVPGATSYTVAIWMPAFVGTPNEFPIATVTGTSYVNSGLTSGFPYTYYVRANNESGSSAWSPAVNATTLLLLTWIPPAVPVAPAVPANVAGTVINPGSINITWSQVAGATSYNVYDAQGNNAVSVGAQYKLGSTTGTSMSHIGLTAGNTYSYKVTAVNANGESAAPTTTNVTIQAGLLPAPTLRVTAIAAADSYGFVYYQDTVEIVTPTGRNNFNIYRRTNALSDPYPVYVLDPGYTSIPFSGTTYAYPTGQYVLPSPDPINLGNIIALVGNTVSVQKHIVMTTVDANGRESAFSQEIWYHW